MRAQDICLAPGRPLRLWPDRLLAGVETAAKSLLLVGMLLYC